MSYSTNSRHDHSDVLYFIRIVHRNCWPLSDRAKRTIPLETLKNPLVRTAIVVASIVVLFFVGRKVLEYTVQGLPPEQGNTEMQFREIATAFTHTSDFETALPFMALAAIDVDVDGTDEIFAGGGIGQQDALLRFNGKELEPAGYNSDIEKDAQDPTYGAVSIDATADGRPDLFVARYSGLYLYRNTENGFEGSQVEIPLDSVSMPLSIAAADLNQDGAVDLYLSNYIRPEYVEGETIFNDPNYGGANLLLLNNGDNTFTDITEEAGIYHRHNSFVSVFVDLDKDGHSDLVVAHDTGVPSIYKNNGDLTFMEIELPVTFSYPMGIAVGDHNNDGWLDLYFSNVGNTLPEGMLRGDLTEEQVLNTDYILLENQGNMVFEDVANRHNAAVYGFGWGVVSYDFNHDTRQDYLLAQNYIRFPGVRIPGLFELYPGRLLQQGPDGMYTPVEEAAGLSNQNFGVNMVVTDFNQDGWPDVVLGNLDNSLRAFVQDPGANNWIKVRMPDEPASIGAHVELELASGALYTQQYYTSEGLGSDQGNELFFGLGGASDIKEVRVRFQNGTIHTYPAPVVNDVIETSASHE